MSNIRLVSTGIPNLLPSRDRSLGLHHSEVLSDLCIRLGHYEKSEMSMSRVQWGLAVEDVIADRYSRDDPGRYFCPGELDIDGLPITLDLAQTSDCTPDELKSTWISSRHAPDSEKFLRYKWQVMSQCVALGVDRGRRHVCHVNGDYKNFNVDYFVWEEIFSRAELDSHRTMILRHRDRMLREGWSPK